MFYDKNGKLEERKVDVPNGTSVKLEASNEFKEFIDYEKPEYIWCNIESENHGLNFFAATYNIQNQTLFWGSWILRCTRQRIVKIKNS